MEDKSYITKQHMKINSLFKCTDTYIFEHLKGKIDGKINIGIISGDFIDHPVSFFINTFLTKYNKEIFNVYCYSECIIDTNLLNKDLLFKFIKHKSTKTIVLFQLPSLLFQQDKNMVFTGRLQGCSQTG